MIRKHNQNPPSLTVNGQVIPILEGNRIVCPHCQKEFTDKLKIRCHIATHHTNCACEHCGKTFKSTKVLKVHIERKHCSQEFFCDESEYLTIMSRELTNHTESKHGNGINVCEQCGKSYSHKSALLQHMKTMHNNNVLVWLTVWTSMYNSDIALTSSPSGMCMRAFIALQLLIALSVRVPKDFSCVSVSVVIVSKNGKQIIGVHPEFEFILYHSLSNVLNQCLSQMLPLQGLMSPLPKKLLFFISDWWHLIVTNV